jgi:hypothetical protein
VKGFTPITFNVLRYPQTDDAYGGETGAAAVVYTGLSGILSYTTPRAIAIFQEGQLRHSPGPGLAARVKTVLIMEPKPKSVTFQDDDLIIPADGRQWKVVGIRDAYERTLQLDLEIRE